MPTGIGRIRVDPQGQSLVVDITNAPGTRQTVYTTQAASSAHSLPVTITSLTDFWVAERGTFVVSAKLNGQEIAGKAGNTVSGEVLDGGVFQVNPVVDNPLEQSTQSGTSAPVFLASTYGAVGDGTTDDYAALVLAIADAAAVNGVVVLAPNKTYAVSNSLVVPSNVTIRGSGRRSSYLKARAGFPASSVKGIINLVSVSGVVIEDVGFKGNGTNYYGVYHETATDCLIRNCWFDNQSGWGAFIGTNSVNCGLSHCVVAGTTTMHCVEINDSSKCFVTFCHLSSAGTNGIELYLQTDGRLAGNRIVGNLIESCVQCGILTDGDVDTIIASNTLRANVTGGTGAEILAQQSAVLGATNPSKGGHLTGNTILDGGNIGITLADTSVGWAVTGNTIKGCAQSGISALGKAHTINGNTIHNNGKHGIHVQGSYGGMVVVGNSCVDNSTQGLNIGDGIRVESTGNSIIGNRCTDTRGVTWQEFGVFLNATNNVCIGNIVGGNNAGVFDASTGNLKIGNGNAATPTAVRIPNAVISQTLAANGAVTFDAGSGDLQRLILQANATSSSITNPVTGQLLTIEVQQDATGSRTVTWPATVRWAANTAPTLTTTASRKDIFMFRYDGSLWAEVSRSLGVPVT